MKTRETEETRENRKTRKMKIEGLGRYGGLEETRGLPGNDVIVCGSDAIVLTLH